MFDRRTASVYTIMNATDRTTRVTLLDLVRRLRDLPDFDPPPGWEERLVERWRRERASPDPIDADVRRG